MHRSSPRPWPTPRRPHPRRPPRPAPPQRTRNASPIVLRYWTRRRGRRTRRIPACLLALLPAVALERPRGSLRTDGLPWFTIHCPA